VSHQRAARGGLKLICGNSNRALGAAIAAQLGVKLCDATVGKFANGEINIKIHENIRGEDVFILQPTCSNDQDPSINVNTTVMELLLLIHTLKLSSAGRITAIIPHFAYARQDRKTQSRVPISASAVARMITEVGVDGLVTVDLHCGQIQGFFHGCPVADLMPSSEFAAYALKKNFNKDKLVVVAPDAGAVTRARKLADRIGASHVVTILKRRVEAGKVDTMQLVGEVAGCECIIVDDMIDTAGTLVKAADTLKEHGATGVHAYATHGILTDPAAQRINACEALVEVVVTDSLPQAVSTQKCAKLKVIPLAPLLAEAVLRIHSEESMEQIRLSCLNAAQNAADAQADEDDDDLKEFPK
jgi:ribose-phosphate pyrophosphokinase